MSPENYLPSLVVVRGSKHTPMCRLYLTIIGVVLVAANGALAQISSINSAVVLTHVFNDAPSAIPTVINNYPASITLGETGVTSSTGFADRDVWYFSNNGTAPYQFAANNYFTASFTITLSGGLAGLDLEAGWLFSNPSGGFGGDLQSLVTKAGVVTQFGGPSYYPFSPAAGGYPGAGGSVPNYVNGQTYTMGLNYVIDPGTGSPAFQYSVNGQFAASSPGDPYFDIAAGGSVGNPGDYLGGYFQIQVSTNSAQAGEAVFGDISITAVPEPRTFTLALLSLGLLPLACLLRRCFKEEVS
jgi:hypothetical protein